MSWLSRLSRGPGSRTGRSVAPPCTADPETCLMVFENHWRQVSWVLEQREPSSSSDDLTAVRNNTDQMLCLLAEERPGEGGPQDSGAGGPLPPMGPILKLVTSEDVLERLVQWHLRRGLDADSQGALLKLFEMLIGQSQQPLLRHTAVLQPLLLLLGASGDPQLGGCPPALENSLVLLLNQVCVSMARQPVVLEMLFRAAPAQQGPTNLLIFSLLVPFIHRDGALGQQARDALLLVMATSASHRAVARYITENSYFCPVLATGLSALYSSLPRKMEVRGDDWHALRREDWMGVSSLVLFMNSLEFCNAVVQVAHPLVSSQLLDYLHNGFLVPVMGPALHKSSVDEMIASTAYLDLFLRSVTETALLKTFLRFILLHRHDNDTILDTLLTRISSNSRLCMVSLSLFRTLLSLNCEDLMLQLVLRYLLPCTHVMLSQRRAVRETDLYGKSADKFLSLIPECCRLSAGERDDDDAFWGKALNNSPRSESPVLQARPSTPNRLALFMRQQSSGGGGGGGGPGGVGGGGPPTTPTTGGTESPLPSSSSPRRGSIPASSLLPLSPDSPMHSQVSTECLDWESGYLEYLRDARRSVEHCSWACRDWSAPYDGENPSPGAVPPPPPPHTAQPSLLAVFPEHFSFQQAAGGGGGSTTPQQQRAAVVAAGGGGGSTTPQQQRAAVVAAARSEWSGAERDSGEWDVTIGKNNCISLTPRSKKRSLQREELPLPAKPLLLPSSSNSSSPSLSNSSCPPSSVLPPTSSSSSAAMVAAPHHHQPMFNGTSSSGQPDACVVVDSLDVDSLEVKKVKRDSGEQHAQQRHLLDENSNQNGAHVVASQAAAYSEVDDGGDISDVQIASRGSNVASSDTNSLTTDDDTDTPPSETPVLKDVHHHQGSLQSVESLIKELLEQAPGDHNHHNLPPGDSNGQGISIEAFTQELRELEERVRERNRAATRQTEETAALTGRREEEDEEEECLASPPELTATTGAGGEAKGEGSTVGLCSPVKPLGQPTGQPYTGPFMVVVFAKLENMLQNSLYVNILLTGIVAQLACYPQPLLRSFLLNTNMVFQPSVKSLVQVLGSVKNRIEAFAASHGDFPAMLRRAQRYLAARSKVDWTQSPTAAHTLRRSDSLVKSRKPSLGDLILRHTNSPTRARHAAQLALAHVRDGGQSLHSALFRGGGGSGGGGAASASGGGGGSGGTGGGGTSSLEKQAEALRVKNAVYCAVIFSEFLKELAALAQEHAVAIPFPHSQGAEE